MKRKMLTFLVLPICLFMLTSCKASYKVAYNDFVYDEKVGWNTSYSDIIELYGDPDKMYFYDDYNSINDEGPHITLEYNDVSVVGIDGFERDILFNKDTGELFRIVIQKATSEAEYERIYNAILNALESKYGKPTESKKDSSFSKAKWDGIIEDTYIVDASSRRIMITYKAKRKSNKVLHSDLPPTNNATATPSPVPTETPNTSGI